MAVQWDTCSDAAPNRPSLQPTLTYQTACAALRCAACSPPPPSPPPGPILLLDASTITNNDVANNLWLDQSVYENDFRMNGVVFNSSDVGGSIALQGTNTSYLQDAASFASGVNTPLKPASDALLTEFTGTVSTRACAL